MDKAEIIASLALVISVISLGFSVHFGLRDRGRIKAYSQFYPASEDGPASMTVVIINYGRRPVNLRLIGGTDNDGRWSGTYFNYNKEFILNEGGRHEIIMGKEDLGHFTIEEPIEFEYLWIEDSLGKKHKVKDSNKNIAQMWAT